MIKLIVIKALINSGAEICSTHFLNDSDSGARRLLATVEKISTAIKNCKDEQNFLMDANVQKGVDQYKGSGITNKEWDRFMEIVPDVHADNYKLCSIHSIKEIVVVDVTKYNVLVGDPRNIIEEFGD